MFHIIVDYSKSLCRMINAGNYNWVNPDISESHFPIKGKGKVELNIKLVHYGKSMSSDGIVRDMERHGFRPATLPELLAFGASYPDKQKKFPIVALGSVWQALRGNRYVACLYSGGSQRELDRTLWGGDWSGDDRFAAIRK